MAFRCATCSELHEGLPDLGFGKPDPWFDVPEGERERRTKWTPDTCVIDGEQFFLRGVLYLPVLGSTDAFGLGLWVSQSRDNFERYVAEPNEPDESTLPPTFGWLSTNLPFYDPGTFALKTTVHFQRARQRPRIELERTSHPFSIDQRGGITEARAWEMVHRFVTN